ncbi:hypothetical protein J6590_073242 [Homalodisca vitripennis]|nr:hypothetical protein J6590_073242 [Homalodisca vitripennis]
MRIVSTLCVDVIGQSCSYQMLLLPLSKTIFIHSVSLKPRSGAERVQGKGYNAYCIHPLCGRHRGGAGAREGARIVSTLCVDVIGQSCSYQMLLLPLSKTIFIHSVSLKPRSGAERGRSGCKGRGTMRIVSTLCVDVIGQSCSYQMLLLPLSKTIFIHSVSLKPRSIEDTMGTPVEAAAVEWGRSECKGRGTMRIVSTLCVDVIGQSCSYQMLLLPLSKTIFIHSVSLKPRSIEDTMGTPVEAAAVEWGRSGCKGRGTMRIVSTLCVDVIGQSCSYQMLLLPLSKTIFIHSVSLKPRSIEDTMGTPVEAAAVEWV